MMKKKVKKIPKYYNGELAVGMPDMSNYKIQNRMGVAPPSSSSTIGYSGNEDWSDMTNNQKSASVANAIGGGADLINMATSGQNVTAGTALGGIAKGAAAGATFGPIGAGVGAALGLIAGTAGRKHGYDKNSTSTSFNDIYQEGSGWLSWFGPSSHEAKSDANRVQSSNIAKVQTEGIKTDYYNNQNVPGNINVLAAEGGIMRKPVDALVSKGELIYDPTTKKLRQVPGSKGKPNKADDVFARLYEGDVVISNSPTMMMSNGKTPAQNLEGLINSDKNMKAKEAIIKKVVNWQEANKTKPQQYAKFDEGYPGFFKYLMDNRTRPLGAVMSEWFGQRGEVAPKFDGFGKLDFLNGIKNIYNTQSDYEAPIKLRDDFNWDQHRSVPIDQLFEFNPNILVTKVEKPKNTSTRSTTKANYSPQNVGIHTHLVAPKIDPTETVEEAALPSSGITSANGYTGSGSNGSDWRGNLYRMAVLSQPLWDRATAESVDYTSPVYKYMPTAIDVSSQLRDADQSYALARYNFANLYPNTGAGMAAGLQAASNRAKQYADIRQWQTNAQNELIGKNVGIYNNWANEHARILNDVYNKSAQNRAAARNINRQNRATALKNWGQIRRDDKAYEMDKMKLQMLDPMLQYGYENYDNYLKWKKENGYD